MDFRIEPARPEQRRPKPADENALGFGKIYSDHMFTMRWTSGGGWSEPTVSTLRGSGPVARLPRPALRPDDLRRAQGVPEPEGDGEPVPRRRQRGALQPLRRAPRPARSRSRRLHRRDRSAAGARPRLDPPLARHVALRAPDHDRDRALHRAQVHPRSPFLHHHRPGRRLLPRGLQPGEDHGHRRVFAGPARADLDRPRPPRTTRRASRRRRRRSGAASPRCCGWTRPSAATSRKSAR